MAHLSLVRWTCCASFALLLLISTSCGAFDRSAYAASQALARGNQARASSLAAANYSQRPASAHFNPFKPQVSPLKSGKQRQIAALLDKLNELEAKTFLSAAECKKWAKLNERYAKIAGVLRIVRPSELVKQQQCSQPDALEKVQAFHDALLAESNQLSDASNLLADYVDIKLAAAKQEAIADELEALRAEDDQFNDALERLESFVKFLEFKFDQIHTSPNKNDPDELATALRLLINKEADLNDDESNQLLEFSDALERLLFNGETVDSRTGRWRYLFGTLEAGRGVVLRKLRGEEQPAHPEMVQAEPALAYAAGYTGAGDWATTAGSVAMNGGGRGGAAAGSSAAVGNGNAAAASFAGAYERADPREAEAAKAEAQAIAEANDNARQRAAYAASAARTNKDRAAAVAAAHAHGGNDRAAAQSAAVVRSAGAPSQPPAPKLAPRFQGRAEASGAAAVGANPFPGFRRRRFDDFQANAAAAVQA